VIAPLTQARSDPAAWRQHRHAPAPGTELGPADAIPDGQAREYTFGPAHDAFRMFIVRRGAAVFGYLNVCPHFSLPLNYRPDQFMTRDGEILCSMHFALFRVDDGVCIGGACPGRALDPVPVEVTPGGTLRIALG
jgi:nitrite reductase/ring-hydroxylating ferredoxin subunit